jgi:hypothetical protein
LTQPGRERRIGRHFVGGSEEVTESDDGNLRDSEIALMDAIKTVFEIMLNAGVTPAQIDKLLASSQERYSPNVMPRAVVVMDMLRKFVRDVSREDSRAQIRRIREEPPAGSA